MIALRSLILLPLLLIAACSGEVNESGNPVEIGAVSWLRNLDEAKKASASSGKPILLLFQEIPG